MSIHVPQVSILLPMYNGARYLPEQIDSILHQRFGAFELVIVDDGSNDDKVAICGDYARRDARVTTIPGTGNMGQRMRLLQLVQVSRAPLISFADQDDI